MRWQVLTLSKPVASGERDMVATQNGVFGGMIKVILFGILAAIVAASAHQCRNNNDNVFAQ
jgi:hypothetical protein